MTQQPRYNCTFLKGYAFTLFYVMFFFVTARAALVYVHSSCFIFLFFYFFFRIVCWEKKSSIFSSPFRLPTHQ